MKGTVYMKPKIICILGETASGKDTIVDKAISKLKDENINIRPVCSYTDRPKRNNETDGVEHYFITTDQFNTIRTDRQSDVLAYTKIKNDKQPEHEGYQYMALIDELEKSHIYIIDAKGLEYLKTHYDEKIDIISVYIHASLFTRMRRASLRSDFKTEFKKRVRAEEAQFKQFRKRKL